ncbi:MAG: hypothetical protein ACI8S6_001073 [Myxococcota bacterium]|jgi:hypothetical protein
MRRRVPRVSLGGLLRDGHWGALRPGISRQVLVRQLGMPTRWQQSMAELRAAQAGTPVAGWALSEILVFDGVEFHFPEHPRSQCVRIFIDDLDALGGSRLPVDRWGLSEGMTEQALRVHLATEGLSAERRLFPPSPRQIRLVLPSGARLGLTDDPSFFEPDTPPAGKRLFCVEVPQAPASSG